MLNTSFELRTLYFATFLWYNTSIMGLVTTIMNFWMMTSNSFSFSSSTQYLFVKPLLQLDSNNWFCLDFLDYGQHDNL